MLNFNELTKTIKENRKKININLETNVMFEQPLSIPKTKKIHIEEIVSDEQIKQEKKTTNQKKTELSNKLVYKENEIINLPNKSSKIFDLNKFYSFGVESKNSLLNSILYIIDSNYKFLNNTDKKMLKNTVINRLADNIDTYFKDNCYAKYNLKKSVMINNIKEHNIDTDFIVYISDLFKINILVIDVYEESYNLVKDFSSDRKTIILLDSSGNFLPLVSMDNVLPSKDLVDNIFNSYKNTSIQTQLINQESLKHVRFYSLIDLQRLCEHKDIDIHKEVDNKKKKKTKQELYNSLKEVY